VRRNKLEKPLSFAIITLLIALTFPSCKNKPIELSKTEMLLGTFVEIKVITEDRKRGEEAIEEAGGFLPNEGDRKKDEQLSCRLRTFKAEQESG